MCGICGFVGLEDRKLLKSMVDALIHRGPDDEGFYVDDGVGLGVRRLSIIDVEGGHQPMSNEDGTVWVVQNGEIYNFRELKVELIRSGHRFNTGCDTEVLPHLYEEYGTRCVEHLNGMFAFALWDSAEKRLLLARDRAGIKPLYYALDDGVIYFASELKSILVNRDIRRIVDPHALYDYFVFQYIPAPKTIFKGVQKLSPGHTLEYYNGKVKIRKYWDVVYPRKQIQDESLHSKKILEILRDSVRSHLISDVPLGAFLSGGIDSSTIVALMSDTMNLPVETFIVGFEEVSQEYNELVHARKVSEAFGTNHHEVLMDASDAVRILPEVVWHLDEPLGDYAVLPTYVVSEFARKRVKVVLTGEGADELFGGYYHYVKELKEHRMRHEGKKLKYVKARLKTVGSQNIGEYWQDVLDPVYAGSTKSFNDKERSELFKEEFKEDIEGAFPPEVYRRCYNKTTAIHVLDKMLYAEFKVWLPDDLLMKVDKMSMAHSLEARVPYLDHKLVEYSAKIPWNLKIRDGTLKYILKKSVKEILPHSITRRRKHGFTVPLKEWFNGELGEYAENILEEKNIRKRNFLNHAYIKKILKKQKKPDEVRQIWHLLIFEMWHQTYIN